MAETIVLRTELRDGATVLAQLSQIEAAAAKLSAKPITISINASVSQELSRMTKAQLAYATAQERRIATEAKLALQTQRTATEQEKQKTAAKNLKLQQEKTATAAERHATAEANLQNKLLGTERAAASLGTTLTKSLANKALDAAVQMLQRSLSEALSTMKEVDSELTTIKKVTGASDSYIKGLGDRAYETASKYGVAANEYLNSVAEFSRAGYGDLAEGLAEIATKTQLVGDINSETANKMLITMDAAYQLGGSVEKLSLIVDQANEIDNKYATSIEKLAEGMPIVASVAANAHITQEQLLAALGTITAKTQVSGSEAARAFRAIILNIMGDTTTEIEDGVTFTKDEIESLSDVLWKYSSDAMEATAATGELVNPMEAIAGLSQAMKDGLLTEQELTAMLSELGGKLRTNSLVALVKGFDTYKDMLGDLEGAVGSADKEIAVKLESWESKLNVLNNSWTNLVANIVDTEGVKDTLDVVNSILQTLADMADPQSESEKANAQLAEANDEYEALLEKGGKLTDQERLRLDYLEKQTDQLKLQAEGANKKDLESNLKSVRRSSEYNSLFYYAKDKTPGEEHLAIGQLRQLNSAYYAAQIGVDAYREGLQRLLDTYRPVVEAIEAAKNAGIELTEQDQDALGTYAQIETALGVLNHLTADSATATEDNAEAVEKQTEAYETLSDRVKDASSAIESFKNAAKTDQDDNFQDMADAYAKVMEEIANGRINSNTAQAGYGLFLSDEQRKNLENDPQKMAEYVQSLESLKAMFSSAGEDAGAGFAQWIQAAADAEGNLYDANGKLIASFEQTGDGASFTVSSLQALAEKSGFSEEVILAWAQAMGVYGSELFNVSDEALDLAQKLGALTEAADGTKNIDLDKFRDGLSAAGKSQEEIDGLVSALKSIDGITFASTTDQLQDVASEAEQTAEAVEDIPDEATVTTFADTSAAMDALDALESHLNSLVGKSWNISVSASTRIARRASGGKSGGGLTLVNEEGPEIIQEGDTARIAGGGEPTVTVLEPGATVYTAPQTRRMLNGQKPDGEFRAAAMGLVSLVEGGGVPAKKKTKKTADSGTFYIPSKTSNTSSSSRGGGGGSSSTASSSSEQAPAEEEPDYWKELQEAMDKKFDAAEKARKAELADLDAQLDALKEARDTEADRLELEEKILAVTEAQAKLANAQAERNVRMYNAATGQWEWIADQKAVQSAQDQLKKAQDALDKFRKDQDYDAAVAAIKAQQDAVNARYDELENKWKEILASVEEPLREIADILSDVMKSGTDRQKGETGNVSSLAKLIADFIAENPSGWKLPGYDSGGVLHGMGGIKATGKDEIILGPELSAKILSPTPNAQFDAFARSLGAVYGLPNAGVPTTPVNAYGASTDSHDTVYSFPGGINLTEQQANTMTLGAIAKQLRILNLT
nr:MAG TPA: minor tail protein [Bacteriophage sp.]